MKRTKQFNLVYDVSNFVVQQIRNVDCLKILFVDKEFKVICRQRFQSLNQDMESKLREEIHFLLKPTSSPYRSEYSQMILNLTLLREHLLNLKRNVLIDVESTFQEQTKSKLGFCERVVSNTSPTSDLQAHIGMCPVSHAILEIIKTQILQICRSTAYDSSVIKSKVQTLVGETRMLLDASISNVDLVIKGRVEFGQTFYEMHGDDQYKLLTDCMHRILSIMEERVTIGTRTITQMAFVSEERMEVRFVKDGGPIVLPFSCNDSAPEQASLS